MIEFNTLIGDTGSIDGARARFEELITHLVEITNPGARSITANPGDWGVDTFVGELDGMISVWQSKFFMDGVQEAQKKQIRDSLDSLMKNATSQGFLVATWTLCIPCSMDAPATQWWDNWKKRMESKHAITIQLWDKTVLQRLLMSPDATNVRKEYFGSSRLPMPRLPIAVKEVPKETAYEDMLFIKQLLAANITELDSAKRQFFNHDLLAREVTDKGVVEEMEALQTCQAETHSLWENRFNKWCAIGPMGDRLPELHSDVMQAIEAQYNAGLPTRLPMSLIHRFGAIQQVVEDGSAGWVRSYREIARKHHDGC